MKLTLRSDVTLLRRDRASISSKAALLMTFSLRGLLQIGGTTLHRVAIRIEGVDRAALQGGLAFTGLTR